MNTNNEIIKLNYPDNVRTRPGKLIGSTENCSVLLRECIDNSIDELFNTKSCNRINIENINNERYVIIDNGSGMPIEWDPQYNCTKAELAIAHLDAGSKFKKTLSTVSVGMNGVGVSAVNALSSKFILLAKVTESNYNTSIPEVKSKYESSKGLKLFYFLEYEYGIKISEGVSSVSELEEKFNLKISSDDSTITIFEPDKGIFESTGANLPTRNLKYLKFVCSEFYNKSINILFNGTQLDNTYEPYTHQFKSKIHYVDYYEKIHEAIFYISFKISPHLDETDFSGSVNSLSVNYGMHLDYAKKAWVDALKKIYAIQHNHFYPGWTMNVIVMAGEVDFSSQTKERLTYLDGLTYNNVKTQLIDGYVKIIKSNRKEFDAHVNRLNEYAASLTKISTINKIKDMIVISDMGDNTKVRSKLPSNVYDASSNNRSKCTLYICEGESAGGNLIMARDERYDAVIPLRGVPLNAVDVDLDTVFDNAEMTGLISTIGAGVDELHSLKNPRYSKIVITSDADVDGMKITALILGLFGSKMSFLIDNEMVYVAEPYLYKQGKNYYYLDEFDKLDKNKPFTRFKGLGEMNSDELYSNLMDPETRRWKLITGDDMEYALNILTNSSTRKDLMIKNNILEDPYELGILS